MEKSERSISQGEREGGKGKGKEKAKAEAKRQLEDQRHEQFQANADTVETKFTVEYPEEYKGPDSQECPPYSAAPWTPPLIICCRCQAPFGTVDE
jgi:hypothetical protein